MKKSLTKLIVSCAAVTAVAAAMAVSASAATYNAETGKVDLDATKLPAESGQMTILVIEGTDLGAAVGENGNNALIKYINQESYENAGAWLNEIPVGTLDVENNTYTVLVGGENVAADGILKETFGKTEGGETGETVDRRLGDVKVDGRITNADALAILRHIGECSEDCLIKADKNSFTVADVKVDGRITNADALTILRHIAGDCDSETCVVDTIQALPADKED